MPVKNITEFKIFFTLWNEYKMNERETDEVGVERWTTKFWTRKQVAGFILKSRIIRKWDNVFCYPGKTRKTKHEYIFSNVFNEIFQVNGHGQETKKNIGSVVIVMWRQSIFFLVFSPFEFAVVD